MGYSSGIRLLVALGAKLLGVSQLRATDSHRAVKTEHPLLKNPAVFFLKAFWRWELFSTSYENCKGSLANIDIVDWYCFHAGEP